MKQLDTSIRKTNFELLRVWSILLVIALHFLTNSSLKDYMEYNSINGFVFIFLKSFCFMADNLFVLISGYFLIKTTFKLSKIINLWVQVIFYSMALYVVLVIMGITEFSLKMSYFSLFPVFSRQYWFFSCYLLLYLISPFINKLIYELDKSSYKKLLVGGTVLLSGIETLMIINKDPFYLGNGKSLIWFIFLYMLGAYIQLYGINLIKKGWKLLFISISLILITAVSYYVIEYMTSIGIPHLEADKFIKLNSLSIFIASVSMFIYFQNVEIRNKIINKSLIFLSPLTFGIYLIHDHNNFRVWLWDVICPERFASSPLLWIYLIVSVILVYTLCACIEYLRLKLFDVTKLNNIGRYIDNKVKTYID